MRAASNFLCRIGWEGPVAFVSCGKQISTQLQLIVFAGSMPSLLEDEPQREDIGFILCNYQTIDGDVIILMSYLPVLKGKTQSQFTNPLAGFVYDNKKYEDSCFEEEEGLPHKNSVKSKSIPNSFYKHHTNKSIMLSNPTNGDKDFRINKIMSLSKRLSSNTKFRCTRSKWFSEEGMTSAQLLLPNKTKTFDKPATKYPKEAEITPFKFPEIKALILTLYNSSQDGDKACKLSFKNYFQMFFKETLSGIVFKELIEMVEKHIRSLIILEGERREGNEKDGLEAQFSTILSKQELYFKLKELQSFGRTEQMLRVMKAYCLPLPQIRDVFLKDVIEMISIQLYESFNCNKNNQYVLLQDNGQIINDFAQIRFSTTALFIAEKSKSFQHYQRYLDIIHNSSRKRNRFHFRDILKLNFREKVVKGNYDGSPSPQRSPREMLNEKRYNLNRAQNIVNTKNQRNHPNRMNIKNLTSDFSRETFSKSKSKDKLLVQRQIKRDICFSIDKKIVEQFALLKNQNDFINTILKNDENARDKIELQILIRESVYFKAKSLPQIERILSSLQFIQQGEAYESYFQKLISCQQYAKMRKIIDCVGEREETIRFTDKYLNYDDYGELSKDHFQQVLAFIVGNQSKTAQVILNTIWNWLQKNGVTSNNLSIRRIDMQIMYERNKLVYYFLISLIFGTNEVSVLDLTQEILIDT